MKDIISIVLIGLMGSGKTTIGNKMARSLNILYIDSDNTLEAIHNVYIELSYYLKGELSFRLKEKALVGTILISPNIILATGGGTISHKSICKKLAYNIVLWVKIDVKEQIKRVVYKKRPLTLVIKISLYSILNIVIKERHKQYLALFNIIIAVNIKSYNIILNKAKNIM